MELDNNSPVSDEQRRLAEAKKVTLQPLHADVQPEDLPDAEIVSQHLHETPLANIPTDTEQDTASIQPSQGLLGQAKPQKNRHTGIILAIVLPLAVLAVGTFVWLTVK
ncbi:MAG TPA: hypothetical protein VIQ80_03105 [Candidatus Saccharimonadales bacterium]